MESVLQLAVKKAYRTQAERIAAIAQEIKEFDAQHLLAVKTNNREYLERYNRELCHIRDGLSIILEDVDKRYQRKETWFTDPISIAVSCDMAEALIAQMRA